MKTDKTGRLHRLIKVFAVRTLTLLILSCHGSIMLSVHIRKCLIEAFPMCAKHICYCKNKENCLNRTSGDKAGYFAKWDIRFILLK